jgi:hypothetical protein
MTFCGVNIHHQNEVAERRIQDLADHGTRSMIHVNARHQHNPFATDNLWPFALRLASEIDRTILKHSNTKSPLELFTGADIRPKINDFRPFGCPVYYVLNAPLQAAGRSIAAQMAGKVPGWLLFEALFATSNVSLTHPSPTHRSCLPTIPLHL